MFFVIKQSGEKKTLFLQKFTVQLEKIDESSGLGNPKNNQGVGWQILTLTF